MLFEEIDGLESRGVDCSRLLVSEGAHIIAPYHRVLDKVTERFLGKHKIGTTGRGIGPAYADKINRVGIRVHDLFNAEHLHDKVEASLHQKNQMLVKLYNRRPIDVNETTDELLKLGERLKPYVANTSLVLNKALDEGKTVLFEGGQATMLDVDHGTYPFVTSSNPTAGGACTGTGVGPTKITRVIGVSKAYVTRVGEGPFPTELFGEEGEWLRAQGHEYGVTTGRPRRCGWFDAVVNRYAAQVNGLTDIVLTKLDVLTGLKEIPLCVAYDVNGERRDDMPTDQSEFAAAKPIYESMPGWDEDISQIHDFNDLPKTCQDYVKRLEELSGCRISVIGTGPAARPYHPDQFAGRLTVGNEFPGLTGNDAAHDIRRLIPRFDHLKWKMAAAGIVIGLVSGLLVVVYRLGIEYGTDASPLDICADSRDPVADCAVGGCRGGGRAGDRVDGRQGADVRWQRHPADQRRGDMRLEDALADDSASPFRRWTVGRVVWSVARP